MLIVYLRGSRKAKRLAPHLCYSWGKIVGNKMSQKSKELIGASFGWGAAHKETELGPQALKDLSSLSIKSWRGLFKPEISYSDVKALSYQERLEQVKDFNQQLSKQITASEPLHVPIVLGGDHSIAIGTWSGMVNAKNAKGHFGLIWIDAHMDSHTPQTTPSHNIHGMPLAVLLGHGEPSLVNLVSQGAKLNPAHVVLIGVRSFEAGEAELLRKLNVTIYFIDEVNKRGFKAVFEEAVKQVTDKTEGFGISIDMDAFDPSIAPGTGTPEPNGILEVEAVVNALIAIKDNEKFCALEIVEFDPTRDHNQQTAQLAVKLVNALL